jgi:hypothetical protein
MDNTSHITQMLKYKIETGIMRKKSNITGSLGTVELKLMRGPTWMQSIKEGRNVQLLLPVADLKAEWKKKGKDELHSFCANTNTGQRTVLHGSSPWFSEIKMNCQAFVSINCMTAGHTSLKASLNRFNIVFTAECECGDGLQMEEHIFWDCKLYKEQWATIIDILSENKKKEYPKSVTELLRARGKKDVCKVSLTS